MPRPVVVGGKTVCSEGDFSVVTAAGKFYALWKEHGQECATEEELLGYLNFHERSLYAAKTKA